MPGKIFVSAGEPSGDLHGGKLVAALKDLRPDLEVWAVGGDALSQAGAEIVVHIRETAFMGFFEVLRHWRQVLKLWRMALHVLEHNRPDIVVAIDYPGFNLRLARAAHRRSIPVVYYISPQIWAWHQSRVRKIKKYVREVLCILPFEVEWYRRHGVKAQFVGHPLLDQNNRLSGANPFAQASRPLIGLFPGSRRQEVEHLLPLMVQAVQILRRRFPELQAVVAVAPNLDSDSIRKLIGTAPIQIATHQNQALMHNADALIIASGTATLEATLHHTPYVVIYKINPLSYLFARSLIKVDSITIANLVTGTKGVTELVQSCATPARIAYEIRRILCEPEYALRIKNFLAAAHARLGTPGAARRAAQTILKYLPHV